MEYYFTFNANKISGTMPTEIGRLTEMYHSFYFGSTQLTGALPTQLGNLDNDPGWGMKYFHIPKSSISGTLPTQIGRLKGLDNFYVQVPRLYPPPNHPAPFRASPEKAAASPTTPTRGQMTSEPCHLAHPRSRMKSAATSPPKFRLSRAESTIGPSPRATQSAPSAAGRATWTTTASRAWVPPRPQASAKAARPSPARSRPSSA